VWRFRPWLRIDFDDAHFLKQREIVFDMPVVGDAAVFILTRSVAMKAIG
jgi:hypothetical protein